MTPEFVELRNPHRPDASYTVREKSSDCSIWSMFVNPDRVSFIRTVVTGEEDSTDFQTEVCIDGHVFAVDCTPEALFDSIYNRRKNLQFSDGENNSLR